MREKEKINNLGRDDKMNLIGVPINPHSAKLGSPYWTKDPIFIISIFVLSIWIIVLIFKFIFHLIG